MTNESPNLLGANLPWFQLRGTATLRRLGIKGQDVMLCIRDGAIVITGRGESALSIPLDTIDRALVGREPHRSTTGHRLEFWSGKTGPVVLRAVEAVHDMGCYAALVRQIAGVMETRGILGAMRIGLPRRYVFGIPLLILGMFAVIAWAASDAAVLRVTSLQDALLSGLVILGIILVVTGAVLPQGLHRRVSTLADLDRVLAAP